MNQQINLYQPVFRRQKKVFSAVAMLQICLFFTVVFLSVFVYGQVRLHPLKEQRARLDQDLSRLTSRLTLQERQQRDAAGSQMLQNEIERLTAELARRQRVRDLLATQVSGNTRGFSGYLEAVARQHVQGNWLTGISIRDGGRDLTLEGKTLSSGLVPAYIDRLGKETILDGLSFNILELTRPQPAAAPFVFRISTR